MGHWEPASHSSVIFSHQCIDTVANDSTCRVGSKSVGEYRVLTFHSGIARSGNVYVSQFTLPYLERVGETAWESMSYYPSRHVVRQAISGIGYWCAFLTSRRQFLDIKCHHRSAWSIIGESMESNCSMIEKMPPKGVSFSDFICTFAMSCYDLCLLLIATLR